MAFLDSISPFTKQLIISIPQDDVPKAKIHLLEKSALSWETKYIFDAVIGRNGLAKGTGLLSSVYKNKKVEGDHCAPAGVFSIGPAFGYAAEAKFDWHYLSLNQSHLAVDDSDSEYYNKIINLSYFSGRKDWSSSERMLREDGLYKWGLVINHNFPGSISQNGSCIYLHIWRNENNGTQGCTAMSEENIWKILYWLSPEAIPLFIQGESAWVNLILPDLGAMD
jgi:D-alanyl-D-alanine dipeptidase